MGSNAQFDRYKKLLDYIDKRFKEEINIEQVEKICHYSYRNINRIFQALNHETIGKYIKRRRLEKAAEYLRYSKISISDIAFEIGFSDVAAFSKAFKNKFNCSPSAFRETGDIMREVTRQTLFPEKKSETERLQFEIENLPEFEVLYLEHRGDFENFKAIQKSWNALFEYASQKELLTEETIFFAEILDDNEISENINCRHNVAIILEIRVDFEPEGLFRLKTHQPRKYAKFLHKGSHESCSDTYQKIYAHWLTDVKLEFADAPTLEFFLNDEENTPPEELLTEICIPVL